jgi:hypothetical protein
MQVHEMAILETLRSQNGPPLEHDPEKWVPVFRKDHAQKNNLERDHHRALGAARSVVARKAQITGFQAAGISR